MATCGARQAAWFTLFGPPRGRPGWTRQDGGIHRTRGLHRQSQGLARGQEAGRRTILSTTNNSRPRSMRFLRYQHCIEQCAVANRHVELAPAELTNQAWQLKSLTAVLVLWNSAWRLRVLLRTRPSGGESPKVALIGAGLTPAS